MAMFSNRLKQLRNEKNLTQQELADVLNIGRATIAGYETKGKEPDYAKLQELADFFEVPTDYLLGRTDVKKPYDDDPSNLPEEFTNPTDAMAFILKQPSIMAYGGYSLDDMTDEEVLDFANDILIAIKITLEQKKKRR